MSFDGRRCGGENVFISSYTSSAERERDGVCVYVRREKDYEKWCF